MNESTEETQQDRTSDNMKRPIMNSSSSSGILGWWISTTRHSKLKNQGNIHMGWYVSAAMMLVLFGSVATRTLFRAGCSVQGRAVLCPTRAPEERDHAYIVPWYRNEYMFMDRPCPMYPPLVLLEEEMSRKVTSQQEDLERLMEERIPWIAFVGDSIGRNVLLALLVQLGAGDAKSIVFERHADFEYKDPQNRFRVTLHWAPFPDNATNVITSWARQSHKKSKEKPKVVVLSVSLWHMLHIHNHVLFEQDISVLRLALAALYTNTFVMNAPEVFSPLLQDPNKRTYMVPQRVDSYNRILTESLFLNDNYNETSSALVLLDVFNATMVCGQACSIDGIHSKDLVYNTLVHALWSTVRSCFYY